MIALCFVTASARGTVTGTVTDDSGKPLTGVMVRVEADGTTVGYMQTSRDGKYTIAIPADKASAKLTVRFSKLGYDSEKQEVASDVVNMSLLRSAKTLKEVTVKASPVKLIGDTVRYLLAAFAGKGDVTLQDALKKVPGIDVAESGAIKYNGKDISNFYIEGMELMGGKYNVATTGLPSSYVSAVEVLNNHEGIKIDRKRFNDNVALNIRLKPKAMFKPMGKYNAKGGYGGRWRGELSGAGMMFTKDFQTILTVKAGNVKEFAAEENIIHYRLAEDEGASNEAGRILGEFSASTPPLRRSQWVEPVDVSTTLNFINKLSKDATLRTNAGYSYARSSYSYGDVRSYFDGTGDIIFANGYQPLSITHKPSLSLEYKNNGDKRYIANNFFADASFSESALPVTGTNGSIAQGRDLKDFDIRDHLSVGWRRGKTRWSWATSLRFIATPSGTINSTGGENPDAVMTQRARSYTFNVRESILARIELNRHSVTLPLALDFKSDRIRTSLCSDGYGDGSVMTGYNRIGGISGRLQFSPSYEYAMPYNRLVVRAGVNLSLQYRDWENSGTTPFSQKDFLFAANPNLYFNYMISAKSSLQGNLSFSKRFGDILSLLTAPVMTDYMSLSLRSGVMARQKSLSSRLSYKFKLPLNHWYANADASYTKGWNNLMSRQYVTQGLIAVTDYLAPAGYDRFSASASITKQIEDISTKISLTGDFGWSRNMTDRNGENVRYYGNTYGVTPSVNSRPWHWIELNYKLRWSLSATRYDDRSQSFATMTHAASLSFFPGDHWELKGKADISRRQLTADRYKTMSLFDIGAVYKIKSIRIGLDLHNILNCRSYSYTLFNDLDRFTYDFALRGRELLLSFIFIR